MASPVVNLASCLGSIIITFAAIVAGAGVLALVAARTWGARSKVRHQAIFGIVGFIGLVVALIVAQAKLRGLQ